jgi:preprotein translocase subunit SecD
VKGFAITLALGVVISLFAAIFVTRTLLSVSADIVTDESTQHKLYGA